MIIGFNYLLHANNRRRNNNKLQLVNAILDAHVERLKSNTEQSSHVALKFYTFSL